MKIAYAVTLWYDIEGERKGCGNSSQCAKIRPSMVVSPRDRALLVKLFYQRDENASAAIRDYRQ